MPNVSYCVAENEVHYNQFVPYSEQYLTFVALENGTFKLSENSVSYSLDNGSTWTTLAKNTESPTVTAGSKILWKAELTPQYGIGTFSSTGRFNVQGNVMSLLFGDNFRGKTSLSGKNRAFYGLFSGCTNLVSAENLSLLATELASDCYSDMFNGCSSLTKAPELPAKTLAGYCYQNMFMGCTSLTTAPELLATGPNDFSYKQMFYGCTSLNYIKCLLAYLSRDCTVYWLYGVPSSGTFVKNASISESTWGKGVSGIPDGWTVENA